MFFFKKIRLEFLVMYGLLAATFIILTLMYFRVNTVTKESAEEILSEKSSYVTKELDLFFKPIQFRLEEECSFIMLNGYSGLDSVVHTQRVFSLIKSHSDISSLVVADTLGNQDFLGKLRNVNLWYFLRSHLGNKTNVNPECLRWYLEGEKFVLDSHWIAAKSDYDPRERPWYQDAIKTTEAVWTEPYVFATSFAPGITLSKQINTSPKRLVSLDITLESVSIKTSNIPISENGFAFVVSDSGKIVGLPFKELTSSSDSIYKYALQDIHALKNSIVNSSYDHFIETGESSFRFNEGNQYYWANFSPYHLGNITFFVGVVAPENEIIGSLLRTKNILLFGLIFILLFSLFVAYAYREKIRSNKALNEINIEIENQKKLVDQKNQEILDSINYAKRIQTAILPPKKLVNQYLQNSFILYKPKDIVAGDFYWMEPTESGLLFAAADCTGHGVPGAMVSVICNNGLNRAVREYGLREPGKILDKTREIVIAEFEKSEEKVKDGMDIALCLLKDKTLHFAGAHNPLWVIRKANNEIEEYKATKQPIGQFDNPEPYSTHQVLLNDGDCFYIFSDGFADQFGGDKGKKFKASNFKTLLLEYSNLPMENQLSKIDAVFEKWKGNYEQLDDICVIGVQV